MNVRDWWRPSSATGAANLRKTLDPRYELAIDCDSVYYNTTMGTRIFSETVGFVYFGGIPGVPLRRTPDYATFGAAQLVSMSKPQPWQYGHKIPGTIFVRPSPRDSWARTATDLSLVSRS